MPLAPLLNPLLDFFFPGKCACCLDSYDRFGMLCSPCEQNLENLAAAPACEACAMPLTAHDSPCPYCLGIGPPLFDRVISIGVFQDPLRSLIHRAKYSNDWPVAELLADRLLEKETVKAMLHQSDILIPVPLHYRRQITRGYNQAQVIARRIGSVSKVKVSLPVVRQRATENQTLLHSRARREQNVQDAFALIDSRSVAGKRVVLVDDVMTTGATLTSLARSLKSAGPISVSVLVLAVGDPRGRMFEVI